MAKIKTQKEVDALVKPWELTQADLDSITDDEVLKGTTRLLPSMENIPEEFTKWIHGHKANVYVQMADALYCGDAMPQGDVEFNEGFDPNPTGLHSMVKSLLSSFEPEYEHKIVGLAYMISIVVTITPEK